MRNFFSRLAEVFQGKPRKGASPPSRTSTEYGFLVFQHTGEVIRAERILREAGFAALDFAGKPLLKLPEQIEKVDLRGAKNLSRRTDLRACSRLKEVNAEGIAGEAEFLLPDESQAQVRRRGRNVRRVMQPLPSWAAYYRGRAA